MSKWIIVCRYIRCLSLPEGVVPALLAAAAGQGMLVAHSWQDLSLHAYTINGRHLVSAEGNERLKAMVVSPDGRFLLTGGCKGFITLRWLHSMEVWPSLERLPTAQSVLPAVRPCLRCLY